MRFELAAMDVDDARLVMEWRNDPATLQGSFHSEPKHFDTFLEDYREYFAFPELPPLFVLDDGKRAAFLRFEPVESPSYVKRRCCEISIIVSPEFRGRGIGTASLSEIKSWIKQQGYDELYAEVKCNNPISQKTFEKAGYSQLPEAIKYLDDSGDEVPICRYVAILTENLKCRIKPVKIIAEAGSNWRMGTEKRDREMAKTLIDIALEAGADAVKFQLFHPETLYVKNAGVSDYLAKAGITEDIQSIFVDLAMPPEMVEELYILCKEAKIEFMATPFSPADFAAVDPYVHQHKIASYEIGHIHLLKLAAMSGKPLLLSTGAATPDEIEWAVSIFRKNGGKCLTLLQCTACYPAPSESMNLNALLWLKTRFGVNVGLSDHSRQPTAAPVAAVALGASVIEKHFTLNNRLPGPDHAFALLPHELKELVVAVRNTEKMLGAPIKIVDEYERELRSFARRGLQAISDIDKGDQFIEGSNFAILRPGEQIQGIHPKFLAEIEGKHATRKILYGEGLQHGDYA
ncbi:MAG: GNAT family N-acetyltransferase [Parachlamydiaceae bacterium]|nr:GNAT family N-acetyltransferase [Parachlamydiaceae bacterium]